MKNTTMSYIAYSSSVCVSFFQQMVSELYALSTEWRERERERESLRLSALGERKKRRDGQSCEWYDGAAIDEENQLW